MTPENLSLSILAKIQKPLSVEEQLWESQLPKELQDILTLPEAKILARIDAGHWPKALIDKISPYVEISDIPLVPHVN